MHSEGLAAARWRQHVVVGIRPRHILLALGLLTLLVALDRLLNSGLTYDEQLHLEGLLANFDFARQALAGLAPDFEALPINLEFYGLGPLLPAYALAETMGLVWPAPDLLRWSAALHLLALLSYVACLWSSYRILARHGVAAQCWGTAALALLPDFLGYGLFNYKDMPVAAGVMLSLQFTLDFIERRDRRSLIALGAALTWLGLQKLAALGLATPCLVALLIVLVRDGRSRLWLATLAIAIAGLAMLYLGTPASWVEPWRYLRAAIAHMSHFVIGLCTQTDGKCYGMTDPDWSPLLYLQEWLWAKIPLPYLLALPVAIGLFLRRPNLTAGLALAHLALFVASAAYGGFTFYDGLRHVLFLLPLALCFIAASGLFDARSARVVAAIVLAWLAVENLRFYPYNYAWFTPTSSLAAQRGGYETDFWGYSLRAAVETTPPGAIVTGAPDHLVMPFVTPAPPGATGGKFVVLINRWGAKAAAECSAFTTVARHTVLGHKITMSKVSHCP